MQITCTKTERRNLVVNCCYYNIFNKDGAVYCYKNKNCYECWNKYVEFIIIEDKKEC